MTVLNYPDWNHLMHHFADQELSSVIEQLKQIDIFEAPNQLNDFTAMRLGEGCSTIVLPLNLLRRYCIEAKLNWRKRK